MIKYLIMDVDGSLTDGKIYMGPEGEIMKTFSIKDGMVPKFILAPEGITPIIITARKSKIVENRCREIGITEIYQGRHNKLSTLKEITGGDLDTCAFFGDDTLDLKCMIPIKAAGGIAACPADAIQEVKAACDYVCVNKAGEGALREFAEWLVSPRTDNTIINNRVEDAIKYLRKLDVSTDDFGKQVEVSDNFFYSVQQYTTKSVDQCVLESHRRYIDIQLMVSGTEVMSIADVSRLAVKDEYDADKDVTHWNIPDRMARTVLKAGDYIVLYPENAHCGAVSLDEDELVVKIVGKIKI